MKAVYPGSFDPITNGHLDIIKRSLKLSGSLTVAVLNNVSKKSLFTADERVEMIKTAVSDLPNVKVEKFSGLLVDFMKKENADVIIRGFRTVSDYEYELQIAHVNDHLNNDVETIFMVAKNTYSYISSSIVKEIAKFGGDISDFVPKEVELELRKKYNNN